MPTRSRPLGVAAILLMVLASGCLATKGPNGENPAAPEGTWLPDCSAASIEYNETGTCAQFLGRPGTANTEADLATHPKDPNIVLVAWAERTSGTIYSAITRDGGQTWTQTPMRDPARRPTAEGADDWTATDPLAVFSAEGDAIVVFLDIDLVVQGAEQSPAYAGVYSFLHVRITIARSSDGGASWAYHGIDPPLDGWLFAPDFEDIAVSPDTGDLHLVAQTATFLAPVTPYAGVASEFRTTPRSKTATFVWKSTDGGATWSEPKPLRGPGTETGPDFDGAPRIAAGPEGLVVITATKVRSALGAGGEYEYEYMGGVAWVSHDGGETFTENRISDDGFPNSPPIVRGMRIDVVSASDSNLSTVTSMDGGTTWNPPLPLASLPHRVRWAIAAGGPSDSLSALVRYDNTCEGQPETVFGIHLVDAHRPRLELVQPIDKAPTGCGAGDDYAGLAYATDGSLWASWSDPRGANLPRIAVAHLLLSP